jgi:hypothetical protein
VRLILQILKICVWIESSCCTPERNTDGNCSSCWHLCRLPWDTSIYISTTIKVWTIQAIICSTWSRSILPKSSISVTISSLVWYWWIWSISIIIKSHKIIWSTYFGNGLGRVRTGLFANLPGQMIWRAINGRGELISKNGIAAIYRGIVTVTVCFPFLNRLTNPNMEL